jgi:hypothetical protein
MTTTTITTTTTTTYPADALGAEVKFPVLHILSILQKKDLEINK